MYICQQNSKVSGNGLAPEKGPQPWSEPSVTKTHCVIWWYYVTLSLYVWKQAEWHHNADRIINETITW